VANPTLIHAARQHLTDILTNLGVDKSIELAVHRRQESGVVPGGHDKIA
jgi:hypothetical protein